MRQAGRTRKEPHAIDRVTVIPRDRRDRLGEGLWWSVREQALYWLDILDRRLNRLRGDVVDSWPLPEMTGWIVERAGGGFVIGSESGFHALDLDPLRLTPLHDPEPHLPRNRMNDAHVDRDGAIWAGTMPIAIDRPSGALYRWSPGAACALVDAPYTISNGPLVTPDGCTLLHTDTHRRTIYAFALDGDGALGPRRPFIVFERDWGNPDGMTFDAEGGLWVACWGAARVMRFDTAGTPQRSIALPASQITNVKFGGAALDRMFVTSAADGRDDEALAGALFAVDAGVAGVAPFLTRL